MELQQKNSWKFFWTFLSWVVWIAFHSSRVPRNVQGLCSGFFLFNFFRLFLVSFLERLVKHFRKNCQKLFQRHLRSSLIIFSQDLSFNFLSHWERKLTDLSQKTFGLLVKTAFYLSRVTFWVFCWWINLELRTSIFPGSSDSGVFDRDVETEYYIPTGINEEKISFKEKSKSGKFCWISSKKNYRQGFEIWTLCLQSRLFQRKKRLFCD